jgi:hypothetical protein
MLRLFAILAIAVSMSSISSSSFAASPLERVISFKGSGGVTLAGMLTLPDKEEEAPFPAVLLLQGSGPTDRDGNQLPGIRTDLLRQIARDLAEVGIASLRFDKRGMHANAEDLPREPTALRRFVAWDNFVADALMGYRWLASDLDVDSERVGIVGHSEGGLIALDLLQRQAVAPSALVLLATPGRPLGEVMAEQLAALWEDQGATPEQRAYVLAEDARIRAAIKASGEVPDDVPPGLQTLYPGYLGLYFQPLLQLDPVKALAGFSGPVLLLSGGRDRQVSPERDFAPLADLLRTKGDGSFAFIAQDASHNLKPVEDGGPGFEGRIDEAVRAGLTNWLARILGDEGAGLE